MFVRRAELLITKSRRATENEEFTDTTGIDDEEFLRWMGDAQDDLQSAIARQHQRVFQGEKFYRVVADQERYPLPEDIFMDNRVSNVWFSQTGRTRDMRRLQPGSMTERVFDKSQNPALYIRTTNELILTPIPAITVNNGLLLVYVKRLDRPDKRRATISAVTTGAGNTLTSLTFDPTQQIDRDELLEEGYISVVNRDGDATMKQIPVDDIDVSTGVVTIGAGFTFEDGETIAVGNFAVRGRFGTNRVQLPTICERYILAYMDWKAFKRDSNTDSAEQTQELIDMRQEIVDIFAEIDDDTKNVPIKNTQFLDDDDLFIFA